MKRKVIQLAGKTFVVSLPISWVRERNVKKGSEITVTERQHHLIITPSDEEEERSITITPQEHVKRHLADMYIKGYDIVHVNLSSSGQFKELQEEDLLGFELVDKTKTVCTYKNVSQPLAQELPTMVRRVFFILKEMHEAYVNNDKEHLLALETTTNKFTNYCKRLLNTQGSSIPENTVLLYAIVRDLEVVGDYYKYAVKLPKKGSSPGYVKKVGLYLEEFTQFYYNTSEDAFSSLHRKYKELIEEGLKLTQKDSHIHYLMSIVETIHIMTGPVLTMNAEHI